MYTIENKVSEKAYSFVGETEIKGNKGFKNPIFWKLMNSVGFKVNDPWCMYFVELVWSKVYEELGAKEVVEKYSKIFSASATKTWRNFKKIKHPMGYTPKKGAIAIFQTYKKGVPFWTGHGVIVKDIEGLTIQTVEGNTRKNVMDRDGGSVCEKEYRNYESLFHVINGLRLLGFIYLNEYSHDEKIKKLSAYSY